MKDNQDRLSMLRGKYAAEISQKESELKELRAKLHLIDELESDAEGLSSATNGALKYADKKISLTDAIIETVNAIGTKGVAASKVAKELKSNGFPADGKNFMVVVGTTLRRLASNERNEIRTELKDGKRLYLPVDTSEFTKP
jgi:hypothetical protein